MSSWGGSVRSTQMPIDATTLATQTAQHSKSSFWHELISQIASVAGVNPKLGVSVAKQESGLNPQAVNSSSGAIGMMQLMPGTAAALGVNPHDVTQNIQGGIHHTTGAARELW